MGVTLDIPPAESLEALRASLTDLPGVSATGPQAMAAGAPETALPHRVDNARLDALARGDGIRSAEPIGWRYLPHELPGAAIEILSSGETGSHQFSGLNYGPFVEATRHTLATAEAHPSIANGDYGVTLLRIPALYVMALWFHAKGGGEDLLFPLPPTPPGLTADTPYRIDEFDAAVREAAIKRAGFDDTPEASPEPAA